MASRILLVLLIATLMNGVFLLPFDDNDDERRDARLFSLRGVGDQYNIWDTLCDRIRHHPAFHTGFSFTAVKAAFEIVDHYNPENVGDGVLDEKEFKMFGGLMRVARYCSKKDVAKAADETSLPPKISQRNE
ncbi:uncharacterized protein [Littorina saxatilis]|uniref:Uncharacterized protein n=1 Tax=Littorina saxatilis TaxID=31220 RepID=A0AAN9BI54_9CAEN